MDCELYTAECGAGPWLVLLHGNGESSDYFAAQTDCFAARFRVLSVDTRGHGRSPRGTAPFTLSQFADDLKALLDARGITKACILGFSDGGNIALLFALRYPAYVERLILNGANLFPAGMKTGVCLSVLAGYAAASVRCVFDRRARSKQELLALMATQPHIKPRELSRLCVPVLVIAGTRDMIRRSHTQRIAAAIPGAELCLLPGDHFLAAKQSAVFNAAVLDFLIK